MKDYVEEEPKEAPIEYMRLFVHIRTSETLRTSSLSRFTSDWLTKYPDVDEQPPLPGVDSTSEFELLDDDHYWPMPFSVFSSPQNGRGIMFQADRVGVFWERMPSLTEEARYPGFTTMRSHLLEVLDDFTRHAHRNQINVTPTSVECLYENVLPGISPAETMLGRITAWSDVVDPEQIDIDASSFFDVHDHHDGSHDAPVWVSLRPLKAENSTKLLIRTILSAPFEGPADLNEGLKEDVTGLIETAHHVATEQYMNWVPQNIRDANEGSA